MKSGKDNKDKIAFIFLLSASICFYVSAIIGIVRGNSGNWIINLCLGSALLCLSTTHLNKGKNDKDN